MINATLAQILDYYCGCGGTCSREFSRSHAYLVTLELAGMTCELGNLPIIKKIGNVYFKNADCTFCLFVLILDLDKAQKAAMNDMHL